MSLAAFLPLAISAGASFLGSKKKKPNAIDPVSQDTRTHEQQRIDQFMADYISKNGNRLGQAYSGDMSAPMTGFEHQGIEQFLSEYLGGGVSNQTSDVRSLLNNTINGGFDPGTSAYYQALRDATNQNRTLAVSNSNADFAKRGKFFSTAAMNKVGDINSQTSNALNLALAELGNQERNRSMNAVGPALGLEQYLTNIPLNKATAATTIGAIPRQLKQEELDRMYNDFKRQQTEVGSVVNRGGVSNATINQGYPLQPMYEQSPQPNLAAIGQTTAQLLPFLMKLFGK